MSPAETRPALSVVVPTFNEAENIPVLIARLQEALAGVPHEIIVADDGSPDGTAAAVERLVPVTPGLRCLRRNRDKGLYPAVLEAFAGASGRFLAVLDADLQHDESLLPRMLEAAENDGLDLAVGSRYAPGGGVAGWGFPRLALSRLATRLAGLVLRGQVADPLSGFFLIRRESYASLAQRLNPRGFKILMDILFHLPPGAKIREFGYRFRPRRRGASKLSGEVGLQFLAALLSLALKRLRG